MEKTAYLATTRVTPFERQAVELYAARYGLKLSEAIRALLRHGAIETGVWPLMDAPPPDPPENGDMESTNG